LIIEADFIMPKTLIAITGPTAIGKTAIAIKLAQYYNTEIISADSRQFYKEMEIGTAKPSPDELNAAKHHFVNSHSITDKFSVGDYEKKAIELINVLFETRDQLILAGGSGLFMNAVLYGFDDMPTAAEETRNTLNELYVRKGLQHLQEMLKEYDPVYYSEVDINNPQRIIRALEVCKSTGRPFSEFRKKSIINRPFDFIKIGLNTDRAILYNNINKRVDNMMESGLLEEAKRLLPYRNLNALNTVGYSELFNYFDRKHSLQEAIEIIKQNTRRFAKRQLTWFNKLDDIKWFEPKEFDKITGYLNSFLYHPEPGE